MPPALERLSIAGPAGPLEAIAEDPKTSAPCYAVVCHPHPLFGGTMENKVVTTLARALHDNGIATLRFNFRGVGKSAGAFAEGIGETEDAAAVAAYGDSRWAGRRLMLGGFSFGAYVALRLALERDVSRLITVAPPVDKFDFAALARPPCPWIIVQGDADEVVDARRVIAWVETLDPQPRLLLIPGVGHFFHGALPLLRATVIDELRSG